MTNKYLVLGWIVLLFYTYNIDSSPLGGTTGLPCNPDLLNDSGNDIWVADGGEYCSNEGKEPPSDQVFEGTYLVEYYCRNYELYVDVTRCSYYGAYTCRDGACATSDTTTTVTTTSTTTSTLAISTTTINPATECFDSDGGDDPYEQGTSNAPAGYVGTDKCMQSGTQLKEYFCSDYTHSAYVVYECTCEDGACLMVTTTTTVAPTTTTPITTTTLPPDEDGGISTYFWITLFGGIILLANGKKKNEK